MHRIMAACGLALIAQACASASFVVTIEDVPGGLQATGSGSLNLNGASFLGGINTVNGIRADASVSVGPDSLTPVEVYQLTDGISGPTSIGPGSSTSFGNTGSGDLCGIDFSFLPGELRVLVPNGYQSGDPLSGASFHETQSIASVGLTPGEYTWSWTAGNETDFFRVIVAPAPSTAMLALCAGISATRRRRSA